MKRRSSSFLSEGSDMTELVQELSEQPLPPGPSEYAGLFRWPEEFWRRLHGLLPAEILESNVRNHGQIYMTSHFSGVGTAEMALAMIQSFFEGLEFGLESLHSLRIRMHQPRPLWFFTPVVTVTRYARMC